MFWGQQCWTKACQANPEPVSSQGHPLCTCLPSGLISDRKNFTATSAPAHCPAEAISTIGFQFIDIQGMHVQAKFIQGMQIRGEIQGKCFARHPSGSYLACHDFSRCPIPQFPPQVDIFDLDLSQARPATENINFDRQICHVAFLRWGYAAHTTSPRFEGPKGQIHLSVRDKQEDGLPPRLNQARDPHLEEGEGGGRSCPEASTPLLPVIDSGRPEMLHTAT